MKLVTDNHGFEGSLPDNRIAMRIKSSAKMFEILSSGIYRDKILAVIREYSCNAYDAHVEAGTPNKPFTITVPNRMAPTFSVEDEGPGIDPDRIGDIYWTYGESSKTDRQDQIGALGLGSKSAFAYTKSSFIVKNRYGGKEYVYFCFVDEHGEPAGSLVSEAETDQHTGITVEFAVRPEDISAFHERIIRFFKHWNGAKPSINGHDTPELFFPKPTKLLHGQDWYLEPAHNHFALAVMGNVPYPIESASVVNMPTELMLIANKAFVINFPMGSLGFASSRESLSYDEHTNKTLIARLNEVRSDLCDSFVRKLNSATNVVEFYDTFYETLRQLKNVLNAGDEMVIKLLLDKTIDDTIEFQGHKLLIKNLINKYVQHSFVGHQLFGLYRAHQHRVAVTIRSCSSMIVETTEEDETLDHVEVGTGYKQSVEWRAKAPKVPTFFDELMVKPHRLVTQHQFNIGTKLQFVINDLHGTGNQRFRYLSSSERSNRLLVNYDKNTPITMVEAELAELLTKLSGATITHISKLPDNRPVKDQEKPAKGTIRLGKMTYEPKRKTSINVANMAGTGSVEVAITQNKVQFTTETISINDLINAGPVMVEIRRRRQRYNESACINESIFDGEQVPMFQVVGALPIDLVVYTMTPGQFRWLQKKGVKLITGKQSIAEAAAKVDRKPIEDFVNVQKRVQLSFFKKLQHMVEYSQHSYNLIKMIKDDDTELAHNMVAYLGEDNLDHTIILNLALFHRELGIDFSSTKSDDEFYKQYPLTKYMNLPTSYYDQTSETMLAALLEYARLVENDVQTA